MGSYNNVSVLIGANADEGMMSMMQLFPDAISTPSVTRHQMREYISTIINIHDPVLLDLIELVYDVKDRDDFSSYEKRKYRGRVVRDLSDDSKICKKNNGNSDPEENDHHNDRDLDDDIDNEIDEAGNIEKDACVTGDVNGGQLDFFDKLNDIVGDMTMFCPTAEVADFAAEADLKVYRYHMTHR